VAGGQGGYDAELQAMLERRFSPEYRTAFAAWLDTEPFTNPDAPPRARVGLGSTAVYWAEVRRGLWP